MCKDSKKAQTPKNHRCNTRLQQSPNLKPADPVCAIKAHRNASNAEQNTDDPGDAPELK